MLIKAGVDISRLNRQIRRALHVIDNAFLDNGEETVVTSTYEGNHSAASLHYANDAVDIRIPKKRVKEILSRIKNRLGDNFDIVDEQDHIHIEYDPKGG